MSRYVAFLRAINVGGHTVKMDRLRALFEELPLKDVETFIASGNVLFDADETDARELERMIEAHLRAALGYEVATFIRSAAELEAIAAYQPFPASETEAHSLYISFLPHELDEDTRAKVAAAETPLDQLHAHGRELYWLCRSRISESPAAPLVAKALRGIPNTMRNSTTVRKIAGKCARSA